MNNILRNILRLIILAALLTAAAWPSMAVNPVYMGTLPAQVNESSGLSFTGGSSFWTHNDGYGDNNLYKVSNTGTLSRTVTVLNAVNDDWEDLCHDVSRTWLYIGDFGNNDCDRTNLRIYRVPYPSYVSGTTVTAEEISFTFPDQHAFPSPWMNFDVEAFFHFNGHLYLFTKADGDAIGYTKMYRLSDDPGSYSATLVDSFYTNDRTTSADISPDGSSVILIAKKRINMLRGFSGDDFFGGQHTLISINGTWAQREAVSFWSNNEIYLSNEDAGDGNELDYIDLSPWIPAMTTGLSHINESVDFSVYPNPARNFLQANVGNINGSLLFELYDLTGKAVRTLRRESATEQLRMDVADLPQGVYFCKLFLDNRELGSKRVLISR